MKTEIVDDFHEDAREQWTLINLADADFIFITIDCSQAENFLDTGEFLATVQNQTCICRRVLFSSVALSSRPQHFTAGMLYNPSTIHDHLKTSQQIREQ